MMANRGSAPDGAAAALLTTAAPREGAAERERGCVSDSRETVVSPFFSYFYPILFNYLTINDKARARTKKG
jgi:hypothetical protein